MGAFRIAAMIGLLLGIPRSVPAAEWLYAIAGGALIRSNLDGSNIELVTAPSNPHCVFWDFDVHTSGAPFVAVQCRSTPENYVLRLRTDYTWEEILRHNSADAAFLSMELSTWLHFDALYYSKFDEIRFLALDGTLDWQIVSGNQTETILGMDVDVTNERIYWVQWPRDPTRVEGRIMRANRLQQNADVEVFVSLIDARPHDVSVDEQTGDVYWSNVTAGTIQRAHMTNGKKIETVMKGLVAAAGVAVHEPTRKLYWVDEFRVRRSNLDGTMVEDVLSTPGQYVYRIAFRGDLLVGLKERSWGQWKCLYR
jgi:hypothetical protein